MLHRKAHVWTPTRHTYTTYVTPARLPLIPKKVLPMGHNICSRKVMTAIHSSPEGLRNHSRAKITTFCLTRTRRTAFRCFRPITMESARVWIRMLRILPCNSSTKRLNLTAGPMLTKLMKKPSSITMRKILTAKKVKKSKKKTMRASKMKNFSLNRFRRKLATCGLFRKIYRKEATQSSAVKGTTNRFRKKTITTR